MTIVEQVQDWYAANASRVGRKWKKLELRSFSADSPIDGKVVIEGEFANLVAQITFWNKGEVCVLALRLSDKKDIVLDDRRLESGEQIRDLIEEHLKKLESI